MAFLEFHQAPATGMAPVALMPREPVLDARALFSRLEHQVLFLARADRSSSLRILPFADKLLNRLFGVTRPNRLADPKLEALRRLTVVARLRGARAVTLEMTRFLAAGFTPLQGNAVLRMAKTS